MDDVVGFMRAGTSRDPDKDFILRAILRAYATTNDRRLQTILLVIFWPGLQAIHFKKRAWDEDADSLWTNVTWAFIGVLRRIDLQKRSERLVQKIINDSIHYLYVGYRREWEHAHREAATVPDTLETFMSSVDDPRLSANEEQEAMTQCLRDHLAAGRIGETEFRLIVGTRLQGQSLDDCARDLGLSRNAAARRRQRAEAALRKRKGKNENSCV